MGVAWPAILPIPSSKGYKILEGDGRQISKMNQGPVRIRTVYKNQPNNFNVEMMMTSVQKSAWDAFWDVDLAGGVLPTDIPLMLSDTVTATEVLILSRESSLLGGTTFNVALSLQETV